MAGFSLPGHLPRGAHGMRRLDGQVPDQRRRPSLVRLCAAPAASPASLPSSTPLREVHGALSGFINNADENVQDTHTTFDP